MNKKVCQGCGYVGEPTTQGMSSFLVDAFIWLIALSVTVFTGFLPLIILPLGWSIFHLFVYKTITCPKCGNLEMVATNSKRGKKVLSKNALV